MFSEVINPPEEVTLFFGDDGGQAQMFWETVPGNKSFIIINVKVKWATNVEQCRRVLSSSENVGRGRVCRWINH